MSWRIWGYNRLCKSGLPCIVPFCGFVDEDRDHNSNPMFCHKHFHMTDPKTRKLWQKAKRRATVERLTHKMIGQAIEASHLDGRFKVGVPE